MYNIICIDSKNKPAEYPSTDKWLVEGKVYTAIKVSNLIDGNIGVKVEEIEISENNPFQYFRLDRFAIPLDKIDEFYEWVDNTIKNQEKDESIKIDIDKLTEKTLVEDGSLI